MIRFTATCAKPDYLFQTEGNMYASITSHARKVYRSSCNSVHFLLRLRVEYEDRI